MIHTPCKYYLLFNHATFFGSLGFLFLLLLVIFWNNFCHSSQYFPLMESLTGLTGFTVNVLSGCTLFLGLADCLWQDSESNRGFHCVGMSFMPDPQPLFRQNHEGGRNYHFYVCNTCPLYFSYIKKWIHIKISFVLCLNICSLISKNPSRFFFFFKWSAMQCYNQQQWHT